MEPDIRHQNIPVVRNEIFNDLARTILDIDIPPIDPRMLQLQSRREQVVPRAAHSFPSRSLRFEAMPILDTLRKLDAEVLFDYHGGAEGYGVFATLNAVEFCREDAESVICAVADEKCEIDEIVRVCQLREEVKVL